MSKDFVPFANIHWTPNSEGEYNEETTNVKGHKLTIYSDREETQWHYFIDEEESSTADSKQEAKTEACKEAFGN